MEEYGEYEGKDTCIQKQAIDDEIDEQLVTKHMATSKINMENRGKNDTSVSTKRSHKKQSDKNRQKRKRKKKKKKNGTIALNPTSFVVTTCLLSVFFRF